MIPRRRRNAAVIIFTLLVILLVNLSWWFFYQRAERSFEEQLSRRLSSLAVLGGRHLTPFSLESYPSYDLAGYDFIMEILESIKEADSLSEVFIIDPVYKYLATTQIDADTLYYLAALNRRYIDSAFYIGMQQPVVTGGYRVGDLLLKSAFIGLTDTAGAVTAVLGIEANIDYSDDLLSLKRNLYLSGAISVGSGILFGIFFYFVQRRINSSEQALFLSQAQANLGRMVAVVSHEIKNPLMIIRASAERLKRTPDFPEAQFILEETDRLNKIVSNYLGIAGGRRSFQTVSVELNELLRQVRDQFSKRFEADGISLQLSLPEKELHAIADPSALRQVVLNLILNAADAVRGVPDAVIELQTETSGDKAFIRVIDSGPGVPPSVLKHIFEPFYTTKTSGSGLGLFLSKKLVTEMKGDISVQSKKGGPTEFRVELPAADKKNA